MSRALKSKFLVHRQKELLEFLQPSSWAGIPSSHSTMKRMICVTIIADLHVSFENPECRSTYWERHITHFPDYSTLKCCKCSVILPQKVSIYTCDVNWYRRSSQKNLEQGIWFRLQIFSAELVRKRSHSKVLTVTTLPQHKSS